MGVTPRVAAAAVIATCLLSTRAADSNVLNEGVPLLRDPRNNCERGASAIPGTGTPGYGHAIIHAGPDGRLSAEVSLKHGLPDATYQVYLIQSAGLGGGTFDCFVPDGTLTTNGQGNGNVHLDDALMPGATLAHVYLYTMWPSFEHLDTVVIELVTEGP